MSEARFIVSDVYEAMAKMPDNSVDLIVTSPPFLALRSYLPADHPDKGKEIGSEPTPAAYNTTLLALTREWRRILTPTGSLCVELGDTYAGSGGAGGDYDDDGLRSGQPVFKNRNWKLSGVLDKSLCGIPAAYQLSLIYGWNMLNPDEKCDRWLVRNKIVWHRPNPPVGALGDKVRPSTSYVTVACTAKDRWFDLDSERTAAQGQNNYPSNGPKAEAREAAGIDGVGRYAGRIDSNPAGAPPLDCWIHDDVPDADVWTIPTAPYAGAHYATFPPALPRRLINLMCPRQVCTICGEPRRRIVEREEPPNREIQRERRQLATINGNGLNYPSGLPAGAIISETWTDCGCSLDGSFGAQTFRRGIVLDPFAGSGTTLQAASELGRDSIGIDLDRRNLSLARQRLGMFLVEEDEVVA